MRHGNKINNLGRKTAHRRALLSNLAAQLIQHKRITTTLAKAKALRVYVEPLITKAKENSTHQRRVVFSYLQDKEAIKELFDVVRLKVESRPGGYTRVIKLGARHGDSAEIAMIELVDYNEIYGKGIGEQKDATAKKSRRGGGRKKVAPVDGATPADSKSEVSEEPETITAHDASGEDSSTDVAATDVASTEEKPAK